MLRGSPADHRADAVDMALDQVTAQPRGQGGGPFQVDRVPLDQAAQGGPDQRLAHHVGREGVCVDGDHRQADAVDRDRLAVRRVLDHHGPADRQPGRVR